MIETTSTATESDFDNHRASIAAGFAAMNPEPRRRFTRQLPPTSTTPEPVVESTDQRVLREAGIVGKYELRFMGLANVESLTAGVLTKKETARLAEIQTALDRLAAEINQAEKTPVSLGKIAETFPAGELPPEEAVAAAVAGDEGRQARRKLAKESARRFFDEQARPLLTGIFAKVADHLAAKITERHQAEQLAHERLLEIYGDEDATPYRPSPGLLRLCNRRRQLIDGEVTHTSPPNLRQTLNGIVNF